MAPTGVKLQSFVLEKKWLDCQKSLFSFGLSERIARARALSGKALRREKRGRHTEKRKEPLLSGTFRHARGHFRVSSVSLDGLPKTKRDCL